MPLGAEEGWAAMSCDRKVSIRTPTLRVATHMSQTTQPALSSGGEWINSLAHLVADDHPASVGRKLGPAL